MPSPFTHLHIAEKIRTELSARTIEDGRITAILDEGWPAFYLGSVAPDFQTISGQPREMTHFYKLPPAPENQAYPRMFSTYPQLAFVDRLPVEHAAFMAAYAAHLLLDLIWFREILIPYFHLPPQLGDIQQRRLLHLILLSYLDKLAFDKLPEAAEDTLSKANPNCWLPFADDSDLRSWQDFLTAQLQPGALSQTVSIYANRLQMTSETFAAKLDDQEWMQDHLFSKIPVAKVLEIVYTAVPRSIEIIIIYMNGGFASIPDQGT